ncbi:MAG: hypothetical protein ACYC1M_00060 [Armatimonadota bacterium]
MEFLKLTNTLNPHAHPACISSTGRLHRILLPLIAVGLLITGTTNSFAITELQTEAESAILQLLEKSNPTQRIFITALAQKYLSPTEVLVTGNGITANSSNWGGVPFKYAVKVNRTNYTTRNGIIYLNSGKQLTSSSDWTKPQRPRNYSILIDYPSWNQTISQKQLNIKGRASRNSQITLMVYNRSNKQVVKRQVRTSSTGQWSTSIKQPNGSYRAVATSDRWNQGDEVRFTIKTNANGPKSGNKNNPSGGYYNNHAYNGNHGNNGKKYKVHDDNSDGSKHDNQGKNKGNKDKGNKK